MEITFKNNTVNTVGELPAVGTQAPNFNLTAGDLSMTTLEDFKGKKVILNIFPSLDTGVCAASVRQFNAASDTTGIPVLCISADLPFPHSRFCTTEGLDKVIPLSVFRSPDFGQEYGLKMVDGPLAGLLARAVLIIDEDSKVTYAELVPEITQEPNYEAVLASIA